MLWDPALISVVYIALKIPWVQRQSYGTVEKISLKVRYVLYGVVVLFYAIPLRWGIVSCCCCCCYLLGL